MSSYRTAMGKVIDMDALAAKNETVRAVGNMKVNARGDVIDDKGRVVKPITERANEHYSRTVGNRTAQRQPIKPDTQPKSSISAPVPKLEEFDLTDAERELEESFEDDAEVEEIKAKEVKKKNGK